MNSDENKKTYSYISTEIKEENILNENQPIYTGFINKSEEEKLREDIFRSPMEKLHLFTSMLRREAIFKNAKISKP